MVRPRSIGTISRSLSKHPLLFEGKPIHTNTLHLGFEEELPLLSHQLFKHGNDYTLSVKLFEDILFTGYDRRHVNAGGG